MTHTLYDSLGNAYRTERYRNLAILILSDTALTGKSVAPTPASGPVSFTQNWYDDQGRVIETETAAGLRTGTIYNLDGSVSASGPLKSSAPDGGHASAGSGLSTVSFTLSDLASATSYTYNTLDSSTGSPWSGMVYNATIDALGHYTHVYQSNDGLTSFTVYGDTVDGDISFSESIKSTGDAAISDTFTPSIPAGGSETITFAQRKSHDTPRETYDVYDAAGNLTDVYEPAVADALNGGAMTRPHTSYVYDASGNEIRQIDAKGHETDFAYDENGNQVSRKLPEGEIEKSTYNQFGQLATHTDFDGNVATYSDDTAYAYGGYAGDIGNVTYTRGAGAAASATTQIVSYVYDTMGRETSITDSADTTTADPSGLTSYTYDDQGNLIEVDSPQGTINYGYDPVTGEHTETSTSNTDIVYGYDNQGRLITTTVKKLNGTLLTTPLVTTDTYDAVGNKKTETLPNGVETDYTYDDLNRLTNVVEKKGTTTLFSETYILNSDGTRGSSNDTDANGVTTASTWTYDADDRLTGEAVTSSTSANSFSDSYTYDLNGNRISDVHTGAGGDANGANATTTNTYNGDDQLKTSTITPSGGSAAQTDYTYDPNGSELAVTDHASGTTKSSFTYDVRNKMITATSSGVTTSYIYDDAGNRVSETVGTGASAVTTSYLTDNDNPTGYAQPLEATSTATGRKTYLLGDRVLGQTDASGNTSYLLIDGHGSTRQITNASGTVTATFHYDAFGGAIGFTLATAPTVFLFGGDAVYDPASGLYLHGDGTRARSGFRFIQMDDGGAYGQNSDPISLHKYLYANGNPVKFVDPSGHDGLTGLLVTMGISLSTLSGLVSGSISALAAPSGHGGSAFLDGFARGFLSTGITTTLLIVTEGAIPLPAANAIGGGFSNLIVDLVEGKSVTNAIFDAAFSAGIGAVLGWAYGKAVPSAGEIAEVFDGYNNAVQQAAQKAIPATAPFATLEQNIAALESAINSMQETTAQTANALTTAFLANAADEILNGVAGLGVSSILNLGNKLIDVIEGIGSARQGALNGANPYP